jgi:hypothetical protein
LGILINPNDQKALIDAIQNYQHHPLSNQPQELINLVNKNFGYIQYQEKLEKLLLN